MRLLGVIVAYFPDREGVIVNVKQYIEFVDKLIIWQNTPTEFQNEYQIVLPEYENKILTLTSGKNEGIAYALNQAIKWGFENDYSHILTMDQDSLFVNFSEYKKKIMKYSSRKEIGIFSPIIKSPLTPNADKKYSRDAEIELIKYSITSGSIYVLSMFNKIGLFREDYFIDVVDTEICYRAQKYGFSTALVRSGILQQEFGTFTKSKIGFTSTNYSAYRTYFIVRNNIWLCREYSNNCSKAIFIQYLIKRIIKIIFHESDKYAKLKSVLKGIFHGINNRYQ